MGQSLLTMSSRPPKAVTETHVTLASRIFEIQLECTARPIESTGRHPFWTQRGWVPAEALTLFDVLHTPDGTKVGIESIEVAVREETTYNLTVDQHHTFFVQPAAVAVLVHNVDPWDILYTQDSYASTFAEGPCAGRTVAEAAGEARRLGRLPDGLQLNAIRMGDGRWATLNNRTLAVAREANLLNVDPVDAGDAGMNEFNRLLRDDDLPGPIEDAVMRCD